MTRKQFLHALMIIPAIAITIQGVGKSRRVSKPCKTQRDQEGPYYKANAPERNVLETEGSPLRIEGSVFKGDDCRNPVGNAVIDIWHCDHQGEYDMTGFKGRAQLKTDSQGRYSFSTIYPPSYGRRPRHIHFKVRAAGHAELTTQLYFAGDPYLKNDFARDAAADRVIALASANNSLSGKFDIYI